MSGAVNPSHYQGEVECIDALRAALTREEFRGYCKGSAIACGTACDPHPN